MAPRQLKSGPDEERVRWLAIARFVFLIVLTILILVLVQSMVQHHFFSGGSLNHRGGR
jgi:hypothetical protein